MKRVAVVCEIAYIFGAFDERYNRKDEYKNLDIEEMYDIYVEIYSRWVEGDLCISENEIGYIGEFCNRYIKEVYFKEQDLTFNKKYDIIYI